MKLDVQLLNWVETSSGGFVIKLVCADEDTAREYFRDKTLRKGKQAGQLFAMTIDEMDEHGNEPLPVPKRFAGGPICQWLVLCCDNPEFQSWSGTANRHAAETWVKQTMCVESRKQIDGNAIAERLFHDCIRKPYQAWLEQNQTEAV